MDNIKRNEKYHNIISKHLTENRDDADHYFLWEKASVLHNEINFYNINFTEIVYMKKKCNNSIQKITDIEHLNKYSDIFTSET